MEPRVARIETELERVDLTLQAVERRLAAIERRLGSTAGPEPTSTPEVTAEPPTDSGAVGPGAAPGPSRETAPGLGREVALVGRSLLALGGGFLLRAITDAALVPGLVGLTAGLGYALVWLFLGHRAASRGATISAIVHAATAALLAFPLAWEAAVRFEVLTAVGASALAGGLAALFLLLAHRHALPSIAVVGTAAASACGLAIGIGARQPEAAALLLAVLAPAVSLVSRRSDRLLAPWIALGAAALASAVVDLGALIGRAPIPAPGAFALQCLLAGLLLGVVELQLHRGSPLRWRVLQWSQAATALILGFGGALAIARAVLPEALPWLGAASLLVAGPLYLRQLVAPATASLPDAHAWRLSGAVALVLLAGGAFALAPDLAPVGWSILAVALAVISRPAGSRTAWLHAVVLTLLACGWGGLIATTLRSFAGSAPGLGVSLPTGIALVAAILCAAAPPVVAGSDRSRWPRWLEPAGRAAITLVALLGIGALVLAPFGAGLASDPGLRAAVRTGTLVLLAVGAAALSRLQRLAASAWLVYPLFAATAIRIVVDDLPHGRPATLFASLALFGLGLLLAPRLGRTRGSRAAARRGAD